MDEKRATGRCGQCGRQLRAGTPEGHCPSCLLGLASGSPESSAGSVGGDLPLGSDVRIGRYRLLEKIGEGGCGVVFRAAQEQPARREVALKILKPGMDTGQIAARFEAERQALAMLDHPGIARIFDGGSAPGGRPFFVMELVRGCAITRHCDERRLEIGGRLGLFLQVCEAVAHAHRRGIIHRDLKPSNVLVSIGDGAGPASPKVIDFGLAKSLEQPLTDKTVYTSMRQALGTPAYMSPEQAGLGGKEPDARADVYSLGVLLYELLTGSLPLGESLSETTAPDLVLRHIRETDPPLASARFARLDPAAQKERSIARNVPSPKRLVLVLRGDLDWILCRCLEKKPADRYPSVTALMEDITAFMENRPVKAANPGMARRAGKFARRNRAAVVSASGILAALLAGGVYGMIQQGRAHDSDARRAELSREAAASEREKHLADLQSEMAENLLEKTVAGGAEAAPVGFIRALAAEERRVRQDASLGAGPRERLLIALIHGHFVARDFAGAERLARESIARHQEAWGGKNPGGLAALCSLLGNAQYAGGKTEEARETYVMALKLGLRVEDGTNGFSGKNLAAIPASWADGVAMSLASLGQTYFQIGRAAESAGYFKMAVRAATSATNGDGVLLAITRGNLAVALCATGDFSGARGEGAESIALLRRQGGAAGGNLAIALANQAEILRRQKRFAEAEKADREALEKSGVDDVPQGGDQTRFQAATLAGLAADLGGEGRMKESLECLGKARVLARTAPPAVPKRLDDPWKIILAQAATPEP